MKKKLIFLLIVFILILSCSCFCFDVKAENEKLVLAYYYVWYGDGVHNWENVIYEPSLGFYCSNDTKVIDQHLSWISEYGIDGFIISWWGKYPINNFIDNTTKTLFERTKILYPNLRLAIMVEQITDENGNSWYAWNHDFDNPNYTKALDETLVYLVETYIKPFNDVYLKWENKSVIVLYAFLDQDHLYDKTFYLNYFNERIKNVYEQTGIRISLWSLNTIDVYCFDVVATYLPQLQAKENPQASMSFQNYETSKGVKVSVVFPRFHKVGYEPIIEDEKGKFYQNQLKNALNFNPDIIFIVSFNEWYESTSIEPSKEFGELYLRITLNQLENQQNHNLGSSLVNLFLALVVVLGLLAIIRRF